MSINHRRHLALRSASVVSTLAAVLLATGCATPEERMAKLQIRQQKLEIRAQQLAQRNEARKLAPTTAVTDQRLPLENVVKALANCDAAMSATVKRFAPDLAPLFQVNEHGELATINVPDRKTPGRSSVRATADARVYTLPITGYFDETTEINGTPQKMAWGFYTSAGTDEVARVLGARVVNFERVGRDYNNSFVRMEIYDGRAWRRTSRFDYYRKQADLAGERSLVIEASRDPAFPGSRIGCAVRGTQLAEIQDQLRPDLD